MAYKQSNNLNRYLGHTNDLIKYSHEQVKDIANLNNRYNESLRNHVTDVSLTEIHNICSAIDELRIQIADLKSGMSVAFRDLESEITESVDELSSTLPESIAKSDKSHQRSIRNLGEKVANLDTSMKSSIDSIFSNVDENEKKRLSYLEQAFGHVNNNITEFTTNIKVLGTTWEKYLTLFNSLEEAFSRTEELNKELLNTCSGIDEQEKSLATMVQRHVDIANMTSELNKTAKDVFELMKLTLLSSIVDNAKFRSGK